MKIFVTGGTGFVGSHVVERLVGRGDTVVTLARSEAKARFATALGATPVTGDLFNPGALDAAATGCDVVIHVAGIVAATDATEFMRVNRDGTRRVLEAAVRSSTARFVLISSLAAFGPAPPGQPVDGAGAASPVTAYGRSKLAGEQVVRDSDLDWTILRPPLVYGPRDTEILRLFRIARHGVAPVFGRGDQELSAVYGPDLAEAIVAAADSEDTVGTSYFPCHREIFTTAELARSIGQSFGKRVRLIPIPHRVAGGVLRIGGALARWSRRPSVLSADKANEFFAPAWTCDPGALTADTGWHARHELASGIEATTRWYRDHGWA